jgi:hypothetical protein
MYRDDRDALLARASALEAELARVTEDRDQVRRRADAAEAELDQARQELARLRPPPAPAPAPAPTARPDLRRRRALFFGGTAAVAVAALAATLVAMAGGGDPPPRTTPPSSLSAERSAAAPAARPPIMRQIPAYLAVAEVYGGYVERMAETYPDREATTAPRWTTRIPTFKFYVGDETSRSQLAHLAGAGTSSLDARAAAYLRHLDLGLPRIYELQAYFRRQDHRDDGGARWAEEDAAIRAWFAEHRELRAALRAELAATLEVSEVTDDLMADRPMMEDIAAWWACNPIVEALERGDVGDDDAFGAQVDLCRSMPGRAITDGIEHKGELCDQASFYRRETDPDRRAKVRRRALAVGLFARHRILSSWLRDLDLLPPPARHID